GITFIFVTHDQEEALVMSDRIAVIHQGRLAQAGIGEEIYEQPATRFVADFMGVENFFEATAGEITALARRFETAEGRVFWAGNSAQLPPATPAVLAVRSEEHTSELQSRGQLVCRLLLEKKMKRRCDTGVRLVTH